MIPVAELRRRLDAFEVSSRDLVDACLAAAEDSGGEGSRTFTRIDAESARRRADLVDARLRQGETVGALAGIPVSVKDLFDVAGERTTAGSVVLANAEPATDDAVVVRRLKEAGAVLIGRTNMTEFAYSGLGLNPHYGTPRNPYDRGTGRIPGGSSSGAAVSVSDGMAAVGIGSDTGGSVRIPAALCGLTGFKPTARRVATDGMIPLVPSLDSIGPIAPTVACCAVVDAVLAGERVRPLETPHLSSLRLGVLRGYVLDGLDAAVGGAFERALGRLRAAGALVVEVSFDGLERIAVNNRIGPVEAFAWHRALLERAGDRIDPRVVVRMQAGSTMLASEYLDLLRVRREIVASASAAFAGYDALLLPTTAWIAPPIASLEGSDSAYFAANAAMLRNPSIFNYLDGCALSVPCHLPGEAPVGLMVAGLGGWDDAVLQVGSAVESALSLPG